MLELIGTIAGGIFSGGATGLLGVAFQRFADYKNRQLDLQLLDKKNAQEIEMRKADAAIMAQEWAGRTKVAEVEAEAVVSAADAAAFAESFKTEPTSYSSGVKYTRGQAWMMVVLDALRGSVRPLLTVYLCAITTMVYLDAQKIMGSVTTPDQAHETVKLIISTVLYLTTTCTLWWFGTRHRGTPPK